MSEELKEQSTTEKGISWLEENGFERDDELRAWIKEIERELLEDSTLKTKVFYRVRLTVSMVLGENGAFEGWKANAWVSRDREPAGEPVYQEISSWMEDVQMPYPHPAEAISRTLDESKKKILKIYSWLTTMKLNLDFEEEI